MEQFKTGKSFFGKEGAFAPMLKSFIQETLQAEMDAYLDEDTRSNGNKRNGKKQKPSKAQMARLLSTPHKIEKATLSLKSSLNTKQS